MPKMKAGPALLQKPSIRRASLAVSCPFCHAWVTHRAPTGYPPINPTNSSGAAPSGILQRRHMGHKNRKLMPKVDSVRTVDRIKKGNRDGITTFRHRSIPSATPAKAVMESRIRITMVTILHNAGMIRLLNLTAITSADSMTALENPCTGPHRIFSKGVLP